MTPETTIESLRNLTSDIPPSSPWPEVSEKGIQIPVRDGTTNLARIYSPLAASDGQLEGKPLLVMIFGGGWCQGKIEYEEINCRSWAKNLGGKAVAISYRYVVKEAIEVND